MTIKFPGIPGVPPAPSAMFAFLSRLKENVELLTGARGAAPYQLTSYRVAALPANAPGLVAYAIDGRKNGEAHGAGSGVMVFSDTTKWCACDTGAAVAT